MNGEPPTPTLSFRVACLDSSPPPPESGIAEGRTVCIRCGPYFLPPVPVCFCFALYFSGLSTYQNFFEKFGASSQTRFT